MKECKINFVLIVFTLLFSLLSVPLVHAQTVQDTITVGDGPVGVGVNTSTNKIYVANFNANTVSVIDGSSDTVTSTVNVGAVPRAVGVNTSTNKIYVANQNGDSVSVIDGSTDTVTATVTVGDAPRGVEVNTSTNKIYVANFNANTVSVIDGSTDTVTATVTVGGGPWGVGVNTETNKIYITNNNAGTVSVIDGSSDTVTATITVGGSTRGAVANTLTNKIYVVNAGPNTVSVIDGSSDTVTATITVGTNPQEEPGVNTATNKIYVPNFGDNTVSVIDGSSNTVAATLNVGNGPAGADVNTSTDKIYVTNFSSDTVSVISDPRPPAEKTVKSGGGPCPDCKPPSFTARFLDNEYPLSINNQNFTLSDYSNNINTVLLSTGKSVEVNLLLYENMGPENIAHVALYTDFEDDKLNPEYSNTNIVWSKTKVFSYDPDNNILNYTVGTIEKGDKLQVTFDIIFANPIGENDVLIRTWDENRNGIDTRIYDAWNIVGETIHPKEMTLSLIEEAGKIEPFSPDEEPEDSVNNDTVSILDRWVGYHSELASDKKMLESLGFEGSSIPHWIKRTFGEAIHNGQLEVDDLVAALEFLIKIDIVK